MYSFSLRALKEILLFPHSQLFFKVPEKKGRMFFWKFFLAATWSFYILFWASDCDQCATDFVAVDGLCGSLEAAQIDENFSDEWESDIPETCDEVCVEIVIGACGIEFRKKFFVSRCVELNEIAFKIRTWGSPHKWFIVKVCIFRILMFSQMLI